MRSLVRCARLVACALLVPSWSSAVPPRPRRSVDVVAPPRDAGAPRSVAVYLHGLGDVPDGGCWYFGRAVGDQTWLVCPRAPVPYGPGAAWSSPASARAAVARAIDAAEQRAPGTVDRAAPGVLVGFSQGAYAAQHLLRTQPGRWRAVAFVAAHIRWTRAQLEAAGVRRAVFAATRGDMMRPVLMETARRLQAEGYAARFVDLGRGGHSCVARGETSWTEVLAWLDEA